MTGAEHTGDPHSRLIAELLETCADDILQLTSETSSMVPLSGVIGPSGSFA